MRGVNRAVLWASSFLIGAAGLAPLGSKSEPARFDNILVNVSSVPSENFTYSTSTETSQTLFSFYLQNNKSSYLNNVTFRASLTAGSFASPAPAGCSFPSAMTVTCAIASVAPTAHVAFDLVVNSPSAETAGELTLNWNVRYGEGVPETFYAGSRTLTPNSTTAAQGGTNGNPVIVSTGTGVPSTASGDTFTASVNVDPADGLDGLFVIASIHEYYKTNGSYVGVPCNPNSSSCVQFSVDKKIDVDSSGEPITAKAVYPNDLANVLVFVLRIDASQVTGKGINASYLNYYKDDSVEPLQIFDCPKRGDIPADRPCIANRFVWSKAAAKAVGNPELIGDWQYELWSNRNGFIDVGY